jgi:PAS domain S-box-containing protein
LTRAEKPAGHILLANKSSGFSSRDAIVLQTSAYLLDQQLGRFLVATRRRIPDRLLRLGLDRCPEGILMVDDAGRLLFANATWSLWTGYTPEELHGLRPPFPFWVSHRDLASLTGPRPALPPPVGYLPFRHRNHSLFWCQVETRKEEWDGQTVTLAFLWRLPVAGVPARAAPAVETAGSAVSFPALADNLPFAVALTDRSGQVLWGNCSFSQEITPTAEILGKPLRDCFATLSAAALEPLFGGRMKNPSSSGSRVAEHGTRGHLVLERTGTEGTSHPLLTYWQTVSLPQGPGFLFAFADDWAALWPPSRPVGTSSRAGPAYPAAEGLVLLFHPDGAIDFWDEHWQQVTGLSRQDLNGLPGEVVLDWLFPQQCERDVVADFLRQPVRRGTQMLLEIGGNQRSRCFRCVFWPVGEDSWLLFACEPEAAAADHRVHGFLPSFARGLGHLINHYLSVPVGLAEMALDRHDLPVEIASWFSQTLDGCMRFGKLLAALQDLATVTTGEKQRVVLALLVREVWEELATEFPDPDRELTMAFADPEALVAVNPRMLKVVLRHLLTNALQALAHREHRRLAVRLYAQEADLCCEIQDTGEGLPTADWTEVFAPFYSTKGPFAHDAEHAAQDAVGLGLTVCRHLLGLHGGRLELRSTAAEGTTAFFTLPRDDAGAVNLLQPSELAGEVPSGTTGTDSS